MESTSDVFTSTGGKFRKASSRDGETERLKKKEREKQARGNARENERRRRFEENLKRKERMVKLDKKRSGVMDRGDGILGFHGNKNCSKSSGERSERWQMGDGFYVKRDATSSISTKKTKSTFEKKERNKARSKNSKVCVPASHRGERKVRTKEWVEQVTQSTRFSSDKLSTVPGVARDPTSDLNGDLQDSLPSWFIDRLGEDVEYSPVKRPIIDLHPAIRPVSVPTPSLSNVSDTKGTTDTHAVPRQPGVGKKSFGSKVVSVLRFFGRCSFSKTE